MTRKQEAARTILRALRNPAQYRLVPQGTGVVICNRSEAFGFRVRFKTAVRLEKAGVDCE